MCIRDRWNSFHICSIKYGGDLEGCVKSSGGVFEGKCVGQFAITRVSKVVYFCWVICKNVYSFTVYLNETEKCGQQWEGLTAVCLTDNTFSECHINCYNENTIPLIIK